jgi:hypothetical protein
MEAIRRLKPVWMSLDELAIAEEALKKHPPFTPGNRFTTNREFLIGKKGDSPYSMGNEAVISCEFEDGRMPGDAFKETCERLVSEALGRTITFEIT